MSDVAARAGVSVMTVSRVLNDNPRVLPETRERVLAAVAEIGYHRDSAARALATAQSKMVGLLTSGSTHFGPANMEQAIVAALRREGYFVSTVSLESIAGASAASALEALIEHGVDGVIAVAPVDDVARAIDDLAPPFPVVMVATRQEALRSAGAQYVYVDQFHGAQLATKHLLGLGHANLVHIAGPTRWFDALEREAAFLEVAQGKDIEASVIEADSWSPERGYEIGLALAPRIRRPGGPTAIFAANDLLAIGLIRALWECGLRVPEDVSVVGFDDVEASAYLIPSLTTVRQPFAAIGRLAVQALLDVGAAPMVGEPRAAAVIPPELVVRRSTAARH